MTQYVIVDESGVIKNIIRCSMPFARKIGAQPSYAGATLGAVYAPLTQATTPAQQREEVYNTQLIVEWEGELLTVTQAAQKWQYYAAEGSAKADKLQALIAAAKQTIREQYPEEVAE